MTLLRRSCPLLFAIRSIAAGCGLLLSAEVAGASQVIDLTQLPCQFLESENGIDRKYRSRSITDCEIINNRPDRSRTEAATMRLAPGKYVFRVTNRNVPYELGFWLRGASALSRVTLPSVSGGGIGAGQSRDYEIELKPGEYVYSCPLNNTPDYRLLVH